MLRFESFLPKICTCPCNSACKCAIPSTGSNMLSEIIALFWLGYDSSILCSDDDSMVLLSTSLLYRMPEDVFILGDYCFSVKYNLTTTLDANYAWCLLSLIILRILVLVLHLPFCVLLFTSCTL